MTTRPRIDLDHVTQLHAMSPDQHVEEAIRMLATPVNDDRDTARLLRVLAHLSLAQVKQGTTRGRT